MNIRIVWGLKAQLLLYLGKILLSLRLSYWNSLPATSKTLNGNLLCLCPQFLRLTPPPLITCEMGAPQHSILFLHVLKVLITTITEHHWLTPFYSSHRSIPHLCREQAGRASIKTAGSNPQPTMVQELWTGASLALHWDKSQVYYKLFPRAPPWGWVPLAHSGHWFHDLLLTAFFPFLA